MVFEEDDNCIDGDSTFVSSSSSSSLHSSSQNQAQYLPFTSLLTEEILPWSQLRDRIARYGLRNVTLISLLGETDETYSYLTRSQVFVLLSDRQLFSDHVQRTPLPSCLTPTFMVPFRDETVAVATAATTSAAIVPPFSPFSAAVMVSSISPLSTLNEELVYSSWRSNLKTSCLISDDRSSRVVLDNAENSSSGDGNGSGNDGNLEDKRKEHGRKQQQRVKTNDDVSFRFKLYSKI